MHPHLSTIIVQDRIADIHRDAARMRPAHLSVDTTPRSRRRLALSRVQIPFARRTTPSAHQGI